ncbi:MAG: exodeoxyribonuclease V subunit gamma, partial [Deltaproteobacteria bacterium]|nr:exodeoxyribonuclease V subunit gamma [Deltaproteobacteria bacterium]
EIAGYNGICANCRFPFPNHFWDDLSHRIIPDLPKISPFDTDIMKFKLMHLIPKHINKKGLKELKKYLSQDSNSIMLFQISGMIADLFDQYLVFRPDMILSWEEGIDDQWQAVLWRALVKDSDGMHRLRIQNDILDKINDGSINLQILPPRISIFGISYLPPSYLNAFKRLSNVVPISFYVLNPCKEYWSDIVTENERRRIQRKYDDKEIELDDLHLEKGNRLLSSMGVMGRDFFREIINTDCDIEEYFQDVEEVNLLTCIQSDILHLRDRNESNNENYTSASMREDSIQIHSCHSPIREVETLYNWLLSILEQDPDLLTKDFVVMTPDIETYAPFIEAVFGAFTDETIRIPYSIADQSVQQKNRVIEGFMKILALKDSRFGSNTILSVLESAAIMKKYELSDADWKTIRGWVEDTNIRWGINAENRMNLGLPEFNDNTWKAGFDRMLLGYALPGYGSHMFSDVLPYDNIEGDNAKTLGKFKEFFDQIVCFTESLESPKLLTAWHDILMSILDQFFSATDETERDLQAIRKTISNLLVIENISGFNKEIEFELIYAYLSAQFDINVFGSGFISGGVTFCAMLPMRSIPFKAVCLIGMNSDMFPRNDRQLSFDLLSKHPKPGDRSRRNDDKYLFLESLISSRKHFYISYVGQSINDNSTIPPSSTVSELVDYIQNGIAASDETIIRKHRRHAFHPQYFSEGNDAYFSYSKENMLASVAMQDDPKIQSFFEKGLSEPDESYRMISINDLSEFFRNPSKYLVEKRLGIFLKTGDTLISDQENFDLNPLEKYIIEQEILDKRLSGMPMDEVMEIQKAKGVLPHGNPGTMVFGQLAAETESYASRTETFTKHILLEPVEINLEIDGFQVYGSLDTIYEPYQISMRFAKARPRDFIHAWMYHLALCSYQQDQYPRKTILVCKNEAYEFADITNSQTILGTLLKLYWEGLVIPLKFFPESSFVYAENISKDADQSFSSIRKALNKWIVEYGDYGGESEDPYFKLCFSKINT